MKRFAGALLALVVLAIVGFVIARRRPPPPPRIAPAIAYRDAPAKMADDEATEDRAVALAVGSLPAAERKRLLDAMEYAATRLEGRMLPGADDLGEGDPVVELEATTKKYLPALNAARSLSRARASAKDLSARAVPSCDDASIEQDEKCVALWPSDREDKDGSRARFLLWAAANAAAFETDDPHACASALREHVADDTSPTALVVTADDLALFPVPERDALQDAAHRLGRALAAGERKDDGRQLESLGRSAPAPGQTFRWLDAPPKIVLVVPRLSALTRLGELQASIERAPACRTPRWIHRAAG